MMPEAGFGWPLMQQCAHDRKWATDLIGLRPKFKDYCFLIDDKLGSL